MVLRFRRNLAAVLAGVRDSRPGHLQPKFQGGCSPDGHRVRGGGGGGGVVSQSRAHPGRAHVWSSGRVSDQLPIES